MALAVAGAAVVAPQTLRRQDRTAPAPIPDNWRVLCPRAKNSAGRGLQELEQGEQRIVVCDSDIGDPGACLFADALRMHKNLSSLNLSGNRIGDEGMMLVAQALQTHTNSRMLGLCLSNNRFGDASMKDISKFVETHRTLKVLNLDLNHITDIGANIMIGALATNPRGTDIVVGVTSNPIKRLSSRSLENLSKAAATVKALALRGVTLGQLLKLYAAGCADGTIEPETTTTKDVALDLILPATQHHRQSYVEALAPTNGKPTSFVVHAWNGLFRDLLRVIASHATRDPNPSLDLSAPLWVFDAFGYKDRSYFLDLFCVNQHATINKFRDFGLGDSTTFGVGDPGCQIDKFGLVAQQIQRQNGRVLVAVDYDNLVLSRVLCLRELHQAIMNDPKKIDVGFSRLPSFPYDSMFTPCQLCKASCNDDKDKMLDEVEDDRGGHEQFDRDISDFMSKSISDKYEEKIQALMPKAYDDLKIDGGRLG